MNLPCAATGRATLSGQGRRRRENDNKQSNEAINRELPIEREEAEGLVITLQVTDLGPMRWKV